MSNLIGTGPNQLALNAMHAPPVSSGLVGPATTLSGTGTYTPRVPGGWYHVRGSAGGGGGGRPSNGSNTGAGAGEGGETIDYWDRFPTAGGVDYVVGAAGLGATASATNGTSGGATRWGKWVLKGGTGGVSSGPTTSTSACTYPLIRGGLAGHGANNATGTTGGAPANPALGLGSAAGGTAAGGYGGGGGGGDSAFGTGRAGVDGNTGAGGSAGTGYGGGGGGGGAGAVSFNGLDGLPGFLEIEEYGL